VTLYGGVLGTGEAADFQKVETVKCFDVFARIAALLLLPTHFYSLLAFSHAGHVSHSIASHAPLALACDCLRSTQFATAAQITSCYILTSS
jgi:hypothetical protein